MQDRPDAGELLEAVAEFLFANVSRWVPDDRRFDVLIAANTCGIVARELRRGTAPVGADYALLSELLGEAADPAPADVAGAARERAGELARSLRAGDLDGDLDRVLGGLREHVERKLEISRPGYAGPQ